MKSSRVRFAVAVCSLLALSGCFEWTNISAPATVSPSFAVSVTEVAAAPTTTEGNPFDTTAGGPGIAWIYSVVIPANWTPPANGTYASVGNWSGSPVNLAAQLVSAPTGVPLPPNLAAADCAQSQPMPPPGYQVVWYQIGPDTPVPATGDRGTLTLQMQAGSASGTATITFQHGVLYPPGLCIWNLEGGFASIEQDPPVATPDSITAVIGGAPVPVLGGGMLVLLAALLALVGVRSARNRTQA